MKILITGFPGTGKSSIAKELKRRGRRAYDPQSMHDYMQVENRDTGRHIKQPEKVPAGWFDTVGAYNWDPIKLEKLLQDNEDIFICSKAHNQSEFYSRFDKIFVLTLDFTELIHRLELRNGKTLGKNSDELSDILSLHNHFEQSLLNHGAIIINASKPLSNIVNEIFSNVSNA